jgi:hypothetical protein
MSEAVTPIDPGTDSVEELRSRAEALERKLADTEQQARDRVAQAELKVAAIRAGIVDLDGLRLLDSKDLELTPEGEVANAGQLVAQLRRAKPWLFGGPSSSSPSIPPPVQPPKPKLATDMTDDEYRAARAAILKQQR